MMARILFRLTVSFPLKVRDTFVLQLQRRLGLDPTNFVQKFFKHIIMVGFLPDGAVVFYRLSDMKVGSIIDEIYSDVYASETVDFVDEDRKVVVDVGAHIGIFTIKLARSNTNLTEIVAIEANPLNYSLLVRNLSANGLLGKVTPYLIAAGAIDGELPFYLSAVSAGDGSLIETHHDAGRGGKIKVRVRRLNGVLRERNRFHVDLMKVDVEGAELEVLRGCMGIEIKRLVAEIHTDVVNVAEVYAPLKDLGLKVWKTQQIHSDCMLMWAVHPGDL